MPLTIRQVILTLLQKKPLTQKELSRRVRKLRWKLGLWENLNLSKKFPEELRRLRHLGRVKYVRMDSKSGGHQFKYVLLGTKYGLNRKRKFRS